MSQFNGFQTINLRDLSLSLRPKRDPKITRNQDLRAAPVLKMLFERGKQLDDSYQKELGIQMRTPVTFRPVGPYALAPSVLPEIFEKARFDGTTFQTHFVYDTIEERQNGGKEQYWKLMTERAEIAHLEHAQTWSLKLNQPTKDTSDPLWANWNNIFAVVSPTAIGVVDYLGNFSGSQITNDDGTTTSTIFNIDASLPRNFNHRSYNCNRNGTLDSSELQRVARADLSLSFESLTGVSSTQEAVDVRGRSMKFCGKDDYMQLMRLSNLGPDNFGVTKANTADVNRFWHLEHNGIPVAHEPAFDTISFKPFVGLNSEQVYGEIIGGMFMDQSDAFPIGENGTSFRMNITTMARIYCRNRRKAGYCLNLPR